MPSSQITFLGFSMTTTQIMWFAGFVVLTLALAAAIARFLPAADTVLRGLGHVVLTTIMAIGFTMFGVTLAHIYYRYVRNDSLTWSEELLKVLVVWFCLLSATFISLRREHVQIVIFKQKMPKFVEKAMDTLVSFLMFLGSAAMCYIGYRLSVFAGIRKTPVLRIPFFYMYISICVSFAIMALYELRNLVADIFHPGSPPAMSDRIDPMEDMVKKAMLEAEGGTDGASA